jgi:hypothetical protein
MDGTIAPHPADDRAALRAPDLKLQQPMSEIDRSWRC